MAPNRQSLTHQDNRRNTNTSTRINTRDSKDPDLFNQPDPVIGYFDDLLPEQVSYCHFEGLFAHAEEGINIVGVRFIIIRQVTIVLL